MIPTWNNMRMVRSIVTVLRNLLTYTEFPNGLADAPTRAGLVTATTFTGYDGGLAFGYDGVNNSYAYKDVTTVPGNTYTMSAIFRMDDEQAPVGTEFSFRLRAIVIPGPYTVTPMGNGDYRISVTAIAGSNSSEYFGVGTVVADGSRTFKVTGYQLEEGATLTPYQKVVS